MTRTLRAEHAASDPIDAPHPVVALALPDVVIEHVAERVAAILAGRDQGAEPVADAWMDAETAARYLGYGVETLGPRRGRQRIYDLVSQRRLRCARDGSRLLFRRSWLDDYVEGRQTEVEE